MALRKALEGDQIPSIDAMRDAIATLARVSREKNRLMASMISDNKKYNSEVDARSKTECVDTLTCANKKRM